MTYATPRRVELRLLDNDRLTILEYGHALAATGVRDRETAHLLAIAYKLRDADPAELVRALELVYAIAWQLERRADRSLTWDDAQTWDVVPLEPTPAELEEARQAREADELVATVAVGTGLPPAVAGELTLSQVAGLAAARKPERRRRRARVHR